MRLESREAFLVKFKESVSGRSLDQDIVLEAPEAFGLAGSAIEWWRDLDERRRSLDIPHLDSPDSKDFRLTGCRASCFCSPNVLIQMNEDLKKRALEDEKARNGYGQPQGGMIYQPQDEK